MGNDLVVGNHVRLERRMYFGVNMTKIYYIYTIHGLICVYLYICIYMNIS
jgi:hypothetical protein